MFSTGSRAAFLFLVILIVLLIAFKLIAELGKRRETLVFSLTVLALLGLLAVLFVARGIQLFNLITSFFERGTPEYSSWKEVVNEERMVAWSNAEISQMGTAELMFGRSYGTRATTDNLYLSLLIMYGVVGMILILILNLSIFVTISSGSVSSSARILAFCLLIVFGISGVVADYWFNSTITPIYMFMTGSLFEEINRRHKQRREN